MVELSRYHVHEGATWLWRRMTRMKKLSSDSIMETPLNRCLTTLDITLLGIGHMVGAGIYVLTGTVARDMAGPAIIISFLLAGVVSILSALCYAEFGARVPKAGSAYVYTYVTIGEFWAFVIGWNIILEHMIGAASVARAWSGYVDSLFSGAIKNSTISSLGEMHETFLAPYPDPLAFFVTLAYCGLLTLGVKGSAYFNSILTLVNLSVMLFVVVVGLYWANLENWKTPGGFAPFGLSGIIAGAATSFYAFVGFDSIATSSEEAVNPAKSIPVATFTSMAIVAVAYIFVGATLTLMVPYYELNPAAAIPDAFAANGVLWAKYIVSIGALCGMTTTLFGSLFSLPRCVYAMASDGLLFSWLARVSEKTQVPILNMLLCGFMSAFLALIFDIEKLVEFLSIGTLMAYTFVSASVIILRYKPSYSLSGGSDTETISEIPPTPITPSAVEEGTRPSEEPNGGDLKPMFQWLSKWIPPKAGVQIVPWAVAMFTVIVAALASLLQWGYQYLHQPTAAWAVILIVVFVLMLLSCVLVITLFRQNDEKLSFSVPFVPYVPLLSIFCNVALMIHLNPMTWLRFIIWMAIGLLVYFFYGVHHSRECEPVSSYSTLLADQAPGNGTVFGSVQGTLSKVTSKLRSATIGSTLISHSGDKSDHSKEKELIIEKEETAEEDM